MKTTPAAERSWEGLAVAAVVFASCTVAACWVFLVPIFQAPDEPFHYDYALCMAEHRGLYRARDLPASPRPRLIHREANYLWFGTGAHLVAGHPNVRVPSDYGSAAHLERLRRWAPAGVAVQEPPAFLAYYTFGYYSLLAAWLGLLRMVRDEPVFVFYGARLLSVALLGAGLLFTHASLREMGIRARMRLFLTACVGLFPLTSFVGSYVQPDNLAFALVSLSFYLVLAARRRGGAPGGVTGLGMALGALLVTKQHFWLCVSLAVAGLVVTEAPRWTRARRRLAFALLSLPSAALGAVYLWSVWGTTPYYSVGADRPWLVVVAQGFRQAILDFYAGTTHRSFWGVFGCLDTPLVLGNERIDLLVRSALQASAWLFLGLTLVRLEQVVSRLVRLMTRGRRALALRLACSNPLVNSYFLFTVFMVSIYVRTANAIGSQGRHWFPMLLPTFLTGLVYAPRCLTLRHSRRAFTAAVAGALALYVAAGGYYSIGCLRDRYYGPGHPLSRPLAPEDGRLASRR